MSASNPRHKICVGQFAGRMACGVMVRLVTFYRNPGGFCLYAFVIEDGAQVLKITRKSLAHDHFIVAVEGVADREAANQLRGDKIHSPRSFAPAWRGRVLRRRPDRFARRRCRGQGIRQQDGVFDYGAAPGNRHVEKRQFHAALQGCFRAGSRFRGRKTEVIAVPEGWV